MKIGYAKIDITPQKPTIMGGFERTTKSKGALNSIEINTALFELNKKRIAITVIDSIVIEEKLVKDVLKIVNDQLKMNVHSLSIMATHSHSAPSFYKTFFSDTDVEEELQKDLTQQVVNSINIASNNLEDVKVSYTFDYIDGVYGNRNEIDGDANKEFYKLHVYDLKGNLKFIFANLACHPTILNGDNYLLSSDLFGTLRDTLTNIHQAPVMITNSYAGDSSTRFYREKAGFEELERVSEAIVSQLTSSLKPVEMNQLKIQTVQQSYQFDPMSDVHHNELKKQLQNNSPEDKNYANFLLDKLHRKDEFGPAKLDLTSNIYDFGDFIFVTLPGDVTTRLGKRLQDAFPNKHVIVLGYANGYANYFVSREDYGKYFETYLSRLKYGDADLFIDDIIKAVNILNLTPKSI